MNQLLSKIDGVDALNNILLIGMTNRKDMIGEGGGGGGRRGGVRVTADRRQGETGMNAPADALTALRRLLGMPSDLLIFVFV